MNAQIAEFTETVACPVCGATDYAVLFESDYPEIMNRQELLKIYRSSSDHVLMDQLVACKGCSLKYLNPRVKSDVIMESYSDAVDPTFFDQNPERIRTFERTLKGVARAFSLKASGDFTILDVGCAGGAFPQAAENLGFSAVGIEPSAWLCEQGRKKYGLDLRPGTLTDHDFPENSFDMITLWDVVEHLTDPNEILGQIQKILKPGGLLILNFPDDRSIARRLMGKKWPFFLSVHLYYFSRHTLRRLIAPYGFQVLKVKPYWQTLRLGYVLKRAGAYFRIFDLLAALVGKTFLGKLPLRYNLGQTMLVARLERPGSGS